MLVDARLSQCGPEPLELEFNVRAIVTAVEKGLMVVCLLDETGMAIVMGRLRDRFGAKKQLFPVLSHKGYEQDPEDPSGGTGLFVLVVTRRPEKVTMFRDCDVLNYHPDVGFCKSANAFFLNTRESDLAWKGKLVDEVKAVPPSEIVPPEFFCSLPLFFRTTHNSLTIVLTTSANACLAYSGRYLLENRRKVVFAGRKAEATFLSKMAFACGILATTKSKIFQKPASTSDLADFLPPASNFRKKLVTMAFLDPILADPSVVHWKKVDEALEKDLKEEQYAALALRERTLCASWKEKHPKPYKGEWAKQMRSAGYLDEVENKEQFKEFEKAMDLFDQLAKRAREDRDKEEARLAEEQRQKEQRAEAAKAKRAEKRKRGASESAEGRPAKKRKLVKEKPNEEEEREDVEMIDDSE